MKPAKVRLDKLLANLGYGSRRHINNMVRDKLVALDGQVLADSAAHVVVTADLSARMLVEGTPLDPPPGLVLMLNKPLGVTCSHNEAGDLVYGLLPQRWQNRDPALSSVGRLDKDTTGLLLLTDDGALLHKIISPRSTVAKRYLVTLDRPLRDDAAAIFASATLMLAGEAKPLAPALLQPLSATTAHVTLTEGRYHQVRRMFAAIGNHVTALHRDRIGGLDLPEGLGAGAYCLLQGDELALVFGGKQNEV